MKFIGVLQAHDESVRAMRWSHNDQWMVTADHAGYVKYWQSNMNNVKMYQGHKEPIRGVRLASSLPSPLSPPRCCLTPLKAGDIQCFLVLYSCFMFTVFTFAAPKKSGWREEKKTVCAGHLASCFNFPIQLVLMIIQQLLNYILLICENFKGVFLKSYIFGFFKQNTFL